MSKNKLLELQQTFIDRLALDYDVVLRDKKLHVMRGTRIMIHAVFMETVDQVMLAFFTGNPIFFVWSEDGPAYIAKIGVERLHKELDKNPWK